MSVAQPLEQDECLAQEAAYGQVCSSLLQLRKSRLDLLNQRLMPPSLYMSAGAPAAC